MKVELNNDAVDAIFRSIFIEDYNMLKSDIQNLKDSGELPPHKQEDLKANKKYLSAMETLMTYYIGYDWEAEVNTKKIKKDKKKKDKKKSKKELQEEV
jgi:hypothetical protein